MLIIFELIIDYNIFNFFLYTYLNIDKEILARLKTSLKSNNTRFAIYFSFTIKKYRRKVQSYIFLFTNSEKCAKNVQNIL